MLKFRPGGLAFAAFSLSLVLAVAAVFYAPALGKTHGVWPAPLDDVYIHFDFARSAANGHPFSWIVGNGYSSGGTSLTYPLILAVGYAVGFRGTSLGVFAALVAVVSLVDVARSLRAVVSGRRVAFLAPFLLLGVPLLDWTWFSGMEVALSAALLSRALRSGAAAATASPHRRASYQLESGLYLAALSVTRPECTALALPMAVAVAHASGSLGVSWSLARAALPTGFVLGAQALANLALTGELAAAGAVRKLVTSNPHASSADVAALVLTNLVRLRTEGLDLALGGSRATLLVVLVGCVGVLDRRLGRFSMALLIGAAGSLLLVCFNTTAPFQNMRYVTPTLAMLLIAAFLGLALIARNRAVGPLLAVVLAATIVGSAAPTWSRQVDYFARASRNIVEQQVEVGKRLAAIPGSPHRVFVGDAGAIPYVSNMQAIDGLGLGGYRGLPFARASVQGGPAVIELIERLEPSERPDLLAVYDSWWLDLVPRFGKPLFSVTIEDNVICGDKTKSVYSADWTLLEDRSLHHPLDRIDVADLVDEAQHAFAIDGQRAGFVVGDVLVDASGFPRFDAGRIIPEGGVARFVLRGRFPQARRTLTLTTDGGHAGEILVAVRNAGLLVDSATLALPDVSRGQWSEIGFSLDGLGAGSEIEITAKRGVLRCYAVAIESVSSVAMQPAKP